MTEQDWQKENSGTGMTEQNRQKKLKEKDLKMSFCSHSKVSFSSPVRNPQSGNRGVSHSRRL